MNSFDAVVYLGLIVAVVTGFNAGLLRSAVTILAYLIAMPIAVWIMSLISPQIAGKLDSPWAQHSLLFFGIFSDRRHGAGKADAHGARRNHRVRSRYRGSPRRRGTGRGARRPSRDHAGFDFRSAGAVRSPTGVPDRFAAAAAIVRDRAN